jgi:hypothetical protein
LLVNGGHSPVNIVVQSVMVYLELPLIEIQDGISQASITIIGSANTAGVDKGYAGDLSRKGTVRMTTDHHIRSGHPGQLPESQVRGLRRQGFFI